MTERQVTTDMVGKKIDPPADFSDAYISVDVSDDGQELSWMSTNAVVHALIVKGGPSYNLYDCEGTGFTDDQQLHSPLLMEKKKVSIPQISHYNFCYTPDAPEGDQGCTPGYWRNHADRWAGVVPADDYDSTFVIDLFNPDIPLGRRSGQLAVATTRSRGTRQRHS
ncbi:MAG TPA: hypothetical protein VK964_15245 [Nocardioidaceae bacterium]|nr:hypothetical protein [Nocardioidaceae bacterium]